MNVVKERKEDVHLNTARRRCTGIDDCTHTRIHVCAHKRYTDCWGEGQYYSVIEVLREEKYLEFVFEGGVVDFWGEIVPDVRTEVGERVKAMKFVVKASEFLACVCLMKSGESRKGCTATVVQKDKAINMCKTYSGETWCEP